MAIIVNFYSFSKRVNSTKQPSGTGTAYNCVLKDGSSIVNPTIELSLNSDPSTYNYAYIAEYSRYYWVNEWTYYRGVWSASLIVDALASWKSAIGSSSQYVLRCSSESDGDIIDTIYPAKAKATYQTYPFTTPFVDSASDGCYAVRVINKLGSGGPVTYLMTKSQLSTLLDFMFDTIDWADVDPEDVPAEVLKTELNPFQYIVSCQWIPLPISSVWGGSHPVYFGFWQCSDLSSVKTVPANCFAEGETSIVLGHHPQATTRGNYLNMSPYSRYSLYFPPYGWIPIDSTMIIGVTNIKAKWSVDFVNGLGVLQVYAVFADNAERLISTHRAKVGVDIQISQLRTDLIGGVTRAFGSTVGGVASAVAGNVVGGVAGAISGIISAVDYFMPQMESMGQSGSFADYMATNIKTPQVIAQFMEIVDEDNADLGRPLCKVKTISSLSGYVRIRDTDISVPCTSVEIDTIKSNMNEGFFYE